MTTRIPTLIASAVLALGLAGCASNPNNAQIGAGAGAVAGGLLGDAVFGSTLGTVGGAAAGAVIGHEIGQRTEDNRPRRNHKKPHPHGKHHHHR